MFKRIRLLSCSTGSRISRKTSNRYSGVCLNEKVSITVLNHLIKYFIRDSISFVTTPQAVFESDAISKEKTKVFFFNPTISQS